MTACGCSLNGLTIGVRPTIDMDFVNDDDPPVAADPNTIDITVLKPDGTTSTFDEGDPEVTNSAVGAWHFQFPAALLMPGEYVVWVLAGGGGVDVGRQTTFTLHDIDVPLA